MLLLRICWICRKWRRKLFIWLVLGEFFIVVCLGLVCLGVRFILVVRCLFYFGGICDYCWSFNLIGFRICGGLLRIIINFLLCCIVVVGLWEIDDIINGVISFLFFKFWEGVFGSGGLVFNVVLEGVRVFFIRVGIVVVVRILFVF